MKACLQRYNLWRTRCNRSRNEIIGLHSHWLPEGKWFLHPKPLLIWFCSCSWDCALTNTGLQARDWGLCECKKEIVQAKMKLWSYFMSYVSNSRIIGWLLKGEYTLPTHCFRNTCTPGLSCNYVINHSCGSYAMHKTMQIQVKSFSLYSHQTTEWG